MSFTNLTFLTLFLPAAVLVYYLAPGRRSKNLVLVGSSTLFYAAGGLEGLLVLFASMLMNYVCGFVIGAAEGRSKARQLALILGVLGNVALLGYFKYAGFAVGTANDLLGLSSEFGVVVMPLGVSFFTFQGLSYIIDVYRGHAPASKNPLDVILYMGMFQVITAGPIVRWEQFRDQIPNRRESLDSVARGTRRFVVGLSKKLLIAGPLGSLAAMTFDVVPTTLGTAEAWLGLLAFTLQIYFDFSGYSDMAIGLGMMFGLKLPENFDFPYMSQSVTEFWRRWHMSLGRWFREYVYFPLGGNRVSVAMNIRNILVVWALTGLWHGASWSFVAWGVYYGLLMVLEKFVLGARLDLVPRPLRHILTMLVVMIGWVFFRSLTLTSGLDYTAVLFGFKGAGLSTDTLTFMLNQYRWELLVGLIFSVPLSAWYARVKESGNRPALGASLGVVEAMACGVLLIACVSYIVSGSFEAFFYARF